MFRDSSGWTELVTIPPRNHISEASWEREGGGPTGPVGTTVHDGSIRAKWGACKGQRVGGLMKVHFSNKQIQNVCLKFRITVEV